MKQSILLLALALAFPLEQAQAAPKAKPKVVMAQAKVLSKEIAKFKKFFSRLSAADKLKVLAYLDQKNNLPDFDDDGIADFVESQFGSQVCDDDSDDDGVDDGDEVEDGDDPADSDSDDDGVPDGLDVKVHGSVSSRDGAKFVINGIEFELGGGSQFEGGLSADSIVVGACLEVEGQRSAPDSIVAVDKVEPEDGCK